MNLRNRILTHMASVGEASALEIVDAIESLYDDEPDDVDPPTRGTIRTTITNLRQLGWLSIEPDCACRACGVTRSLYRITDEGRKRLHSKRIHP